ncbi:MAG: transferrin receptor-like dimerization domain-containing protein [Flavobacteriaceae bacterium]
MNLKIPFILTLFITVNLSAQTNSIIGFTPKNVANQLKLEAQFDSYLKADNLRTLMKRLSARPHHVGSAYDKKNAKFIASKFKSWGYDTSIKTYYVLFPTPKIRVLKMISPIKYKALLKEPALKEDATSNQQKEQLPIYNAYSTDGDVTGDLVYVNYGVPKDYEELERLGISVKGKIVIAKYFGSWRGIKPKLAAEKGAIGCIIYSDPKDDGYRQGDVYPKGAFKNEYGAQRGSVMDMPLYPGDPLTPGYAATKNAKRLAIKNTPTITKIPVLPISYHDAKPLLKALSGPVAPQSWQGALPITYHIGPGATKVHLKVAFNWDIKPVYNVVAKMYGSEFPDKWVMRGNHHDAWVNGANDPISGMVSLMEEARAMSLLKKSGWQPKRTIVYFAWDAEEPGLLGSTEWAEDHIAELQQKAVAYINTDGSGRGFLFAGGSHSLQTFFNEVTQSVIDPEKGVTVGNRRHAFDVANDNPKVSNQFELSPLGSGSDYTVFLDHLGIAAMNIGFGGESSGGEYHSIYDSFDHYTRFKDPTFAYGVALSKTTGHSVLRLVNSDVLPFDFTQLSRKISGYTSELKKLLNSIRKKTATHNKNVKNRVYELASDPTKKFVAPQLKKEVPFLNFAPLENAVSELNENAKKVQKYIKTNTLTGSNLDKLNTLLYQSERYLINKKGLPRRPWFKNQIYAPGFYTGYGVKTLPAVREAIEQKNWKEAQEQIFVIADVINKYSTYLNKIIPNK